MSNRVLCCAALLLPLALPACNSAKTAPKSTGPGSAAPAPPAPPPPTIKPGGPMH